MPLQFVRFKHARFSARFPEGFRYSRSHYWMAPVEGEPTLWRVGFTKFATRMLGELVEAQFKVKEGEAIAPGDAIGHVEGFKAASDVLCVMRGTFGAMNPALQVDACIVKNDPPTKSAGSTPRAANRRKISLDVQGYVALLQTTIQRMAEAGHGEDQSDSPEE